MHNSKAIEVLKSFSAKQLRRLEEFVASPYFNTNGEIIAFLQYLKQFAPRFVNKKLERKTVWKNIFPKQKNRVQLGGMRAAGMSVSSISLSSVVDTRYAYVTSRSSITGLVSKLART